MAVRGLFVLMSQVTSSVWASWENWMYIDHQNIWNDNLQLHQYHILPESLSLVALIRVTPFPSADQLDHIAGCSSAHQQGPEHQLHPYQYLPAGRAAGQPVQSRPHGQPGANVPARADGEWHPYIDTSHTNTLNVYVHQLKGHVIHTWCVIWANALGPTRGDWWVTVGWHLTEDPKQEQMNVLGVDTT